MKRLFRIQGNGKTKDIGQPLIPLGLQAVGDLLPEQVAQLAAPRYARTSRQPGLVR